jgi:MoCo/4Fe-4S cofactor protein with predicted Tat translocation signal
MSETNNSSQPLNLAGIRTKLESTSGRHYWKSLEEVAGTPAFQEALEREFPSEARTWSDSVGRRHFLSIMGASLALAGVTGCTRQPKEFILPFAAQPEEALPGVPRYFATAMPFGGVGEPVLVECHANRPTKIEGNPDHPLSLGASSLQAQASVLNMYDPDRLRSVVTGTRGSGWNAFTTEFRRQASIQAQKRGSGLRILSASSTSPTFKAAMDRVRVRFPEAVWHQWEPVNRDAAVASSLSCFGRVVDTKYDLGAAKVILSLDADILANNSGGVRALKDFANGRDVENGRADMNRLYVVEPVPSVTGTNADHRLRLKAAEVESFAVALAQRLGVSTTAVAPALSETATGWIEPLAADLRSAGSTAVVIPGDQQTPGVHALAHAINEQLGAVGTTVSHSAPLDVEPVDQLSSLRDLVSAMSAGSVEMLVILGGNPSYDAPGEFGFSELLEHVPFRVMLTEAGNETSSVCHWQLPATHYLEAWGDIHAKDGSLILQQPMIEPIFGGKSQIEFLSMLLEEDAIGRDLVRATYAASTGSTDDALEASWRKALHDGVVAGSAAEPLTATVGSEWDSVVAPAPSEGVELVLRPDPTVWDGIYSNNGWMQELPKPITKLTWENVVQVSPATSETLGLRSGEIVELGSGDSRVRGPVWITPGQADDVLAIHLGYGRTHAGRVGTGIGFSAYALQTGEARWHAPSVDLTKRNEFTSLACVQDHHSMEGRHLVREASAAEYVEHPDFAQTIGGHGGGATEHAEPGTGSPFVGIVGADSPDGPKANLEFESGRTTGNAYADVENRKSFFPEWNYTNYAWGMTIDLNRCVGCNGCMAACQAENNIPVIGKDEVAKGREMHWIRIDRYFEGDLDDPATYYQPLTCMQCENAPCEVVCPVGATLHSSEGLNDMVYNRCVGTRYCSNNCPYKVRRFNFLLYQDFETDTVKLQRNPDVTVRTRGVMEKCTYCVQRINHARTTSEKEGRSIRAGEIQTACQQVCPADAITFGDINNPDERVTQLKQDSRNYGLLEELNVQPRTTYLARVSNPNPEMPTSGTGGGHSEDHAMATQATGV